MPEASRLLPKVCFLLPTHWSAAMGGAEFQARELMRTMHGSKKYDIYFLARDVGDNLNYESHKVIRVGKPHALQKYGYFFDACQLLKKLNTLKPDIIYQRVGCAYTGVAARYAKQSKCKIVWHISSTDDVTPMDLDLAKIVRRPHHFLEKKILEYGIRNLNEFIVQTEDQRHLLHKHYGKSATQLVRNFIEIPERADKEDKTLKVLWIGNLKGLKQPQLFVDLAKELAIPGKLEFTMIGAEFHSQSLQTDFENSVGTIHGLKYLGKLSQEQVNEQLASAHLLVNTSVYEGFSNTFIQAWMHSVPVVSLNVDPDRLLSERNIGIFSGSNDALSKDVRYLCTNMQVRTRMGQDARQFAIDNFSMRNAEHLEAYIASLLSLDKSPRLDDQASKS